MADLLEYQKQRIDAMELEIEQLRKTIEELTLLIEVKN